MSNGAKAPIVMRDLPDVQDIEGRMLLYRDNHGRPSEGTIDSARRFGTRLFGLTFTEALRGIADPPEEVYVPYSWPADEDGDDDGEYEDDDDEEEEDDETAAADDYDEYARIEQHKEKLLTLGGSDEEAVKILLDLGLDFRDERGFPLRCTRYLATQAECAARGLYGKMPDPNEANADRWGRGLEADAARFKEKKRAGKNGPS